MCNKIISLINNGSRFSNKSKKLASYPNFQYKEGLVIGQVQPKILWV
jgi:hypothetical protein